MNGWYRILPLAIALVFSAMAQAEPAAILQVPAGFDMAVWLPAEPADREPTGRLPIVLLSHGGGPGGGSPLILSGLAEAIASGGFIVAAPFHGKAPLAARGVEITQGLASLLADPRFGVRADPARLGLLGFSLGGAVALELAGARADPDHFAAYCTAHPADAMSCGGGPGPSRGRSVVPSPRLPLKSLVLLDPLAALFTADGLAAVRLPVLIVRPSDSALPGDGNAFALAVALPQPPILDRVPGGHFVFAGPCSPAQQAAAPDICPVSDADRAAIRIRVAQHIVEFLRQTL